MECSQTKRHLSEYIDGVLNTEKAAKVEDHLKMCADCRDELEALKGMIQTLGSLDIMEAPKGFMEGVHQRIERRSWWSRIFKSLFLPFRLKIPIQVASWATAGLLVFLVFHNMGTQEEVTTLMQEPGRRVAAEKTMDAAPQAIKPQKATRPAPALMKAEALPEKRAGKSVQLVLRVSKGNEYTSSRLRKSSPPAEKKLVRTARKRKEGYLDQVGGTKAPKDVPAGKASSAEADLAEESAPVPGVVPTKRAADRATISVAGGYDQLSARMSQWTREAGGRILRTDYEEPTGRPGRFSVEIPVGKVADFLEKLSGIGSIETLPEISSQETGKIVQLDIRLTYDR
jgi:hypothetical protein